MNHANELARAGIPILRFAADSEVVIGLSGHVTATFNLETGEWTARPSGRHGRGVGSLVRFAADLVEELQGAGKG